jgi:hypothetical protein
MPDIAFALSITPIATTLLTTPLPNKKGRDRLRHFVPPTSVDSRVFRQDLATDWREAFVSDYCGQTSNY